MTWRMVLAVVLMIALAFALATVAFGCSPQLRADVPVLSDNVTASPTMTGQAAVAVSTSQPVNQSGSAGDVTGGQRAVTIGTANLNVNGGALVSIAWAAVAGLAILAGSGLIVKLLLAKMTLPPKPGKSPRREWAGDS